MVRQIAFVAAMALVLAVGAVSWYSTRQLVRTLHAVQNTEAALLEIERFLASLMNAESSHRGYLLTGELEFLDPYRGALQAVPDSLASLRGLISDDPRQSQRLDALDALATERLAFFARTIEIQRGAGTNVALRERLRAGKSLMDRTVQVARQMSAVEQQRLEIGQEQAERRVEAANTVLVAGGIASLGVILFVFLQMGREVKRRRGAEADLQHLNAQLEEEVAARTAEVRREAEERRRSAETLTAIVEEAPFAIVALEPDGRVLIWNSGAQRIFGYEDDEVIGRPSPIVPEDRRDEAAAHFARCAAGERLRGVDVRRRRKDGSLVDLVYAAAPLFDDDGALRAVVFIIEDVSERRLLEQQLRHSQRMEAVGQLTGGMAHDFNNLLSIIIGNLDLIQERSGTDGELAESSQAALDAALRGADLVRNLLAFARRQPLAPRLIDLNDGLPRILGMLRRTLGEAIEVTAVPGQDLWRAVADPAQLESAIVNLAINARDAMPGGGALTIETGNAHLDEHYASLHAEVAPGDYVMLAVSDNGRGMPPEVVERAFEPFFTTKEAAGGTGLGLSMIYGFVKQSGGHVKIYSEVGHGTTVRLYLPRAVTEEDAEAVAAIAAGEEPRGSETILLVEDNEAVRRIAAHQLAGLGYSVVEADTGRAALDLIEAGATPDLLLTDIVLPGGMTGYDLAVAARRVRPEIKILYTSGYTERSQNGARGAPAGVPILSKPYRRSELAVRVRNSLDSPNQGEGRSR